jgi:hypothetical protein
MLGKKRMRLWRCDGHVDGLEDVQRIYGRPERHLGDAVSRVWAARSGTLFHVANK